jgi:sirohydrochlorin cobaltochelatase
LLEFQKPTIPEAWENLVAQGVDHIHVAPLLLFAAGHARQDIPQAIEDCCRSTPGVAFDQSLPLSRHRAIVDLVVQRVLTTVADSAAHAGSALRGPTSNRVALVMVGRGSYDPCAQADMRVLSELVNYRIDVATTRTAFYAMANPRLPEVLTEVADSGRYDHIIIHPHLLFAGRLHQAIIDQTEQVAVNYPDTAFRVSPYLGPDDAIAQAIADRIEQTAFANESLPGNVNR